MEKCGTFSFMVRKVIKTRRNIMESFFSKGFLVLILGITLFYSLKADGNIDVIDTLILVPFVLISIFYFISPIFLSVSKIEAVDNWFDSLFEFKFLKKGK